ncbi:MAG: Sugar-specific transcriptional regulator TrmB [Candidatus Methanofastidiosum methylothiophilum]|uniref:Sugar-specific transcriptional regulator TrmB n=1 Tax=Candidatus Methanofastidiosum methylothiophilum TaxID=1705564 RepID=A0A150IZ65_9EURY|nr:MAG: Sugar-specific transcriptional regulator TrmB [Candidatus Methanofastidiosum methylthiophilus]KYC47595.1 MAG: Sugar-specific transcriptional regulator TrmB [Candidatus Methanofastidiosum methylthiophilus]KYC50212.1 MAG: Sugar-specific transcriptional regulator TrmB [Candidatus Methanofastidiosum methylthiophilus]
MEIEERLMKIGLKEYESKVIVSIIKNSESSAKDISIDSGVPYSRIYDTLNELLKKEWIKKKEGRPSLFILGDVNERINEYINENKKMAETIKLTLENLSDKNRYELLPTINVERNWNNFYKKLEELSNGSKELTCVFGFFNLNSFEKINSILNNKYFPKNLFVKSEILNKELIKELKSIPPLFNIRVLPFTPKVLLFLFNGKDILIVLPPLSENMNSEEEEIKFLEIRNFEIGKILDKMIQIALVESLPLEDIQELSS